MSRRALSVLLGAFGAAAILMGLGSGCPGTSAPLSGVGTLTLRLDTSSIVTGDGDLEADVLTTAELLDSTGATIKNATINADGSATFSLDGVAAGDYFIRVNSLGDNLVATRIDDPTQSVTQWVGKTLQVSVIGSVSDPTYRLKMFPKGQLEHPVVKYSDGTSVAPEEYAYALVSYKTNPQKIELRVLGTGAALAILPPNVNIHPATPGVGVQPFVSYVLRTPGSSHHSDSYGGIDANCSQCHSSSSLHTTLDTKAGQWTDITLETGWCYRCHYGKAGDGKGFVDPSR